MFYCYMCHETVVGEERWAVLKVLQWSMVNEKGPLCEECSRDWRREIISEVKSATFAAFHEEEWVQPPIPQTVLQRPVPRTVSPSVSPKHTMGGECAACDTVRNTAWHPKPPKPNLIKRLFHKY